MILHDARAIILHESCRRESEFHIFPRPNDMTHHENKLQLFAASCSFTNLCWLRDPVNHFTCISAFIASDMYTWCNLYAHCLSRASTFLDIIYSETSLSLFCDEGDVRGSVRLLRTAALSVLGYMNITLLNQLQLICASSNTEKTTYICRKKREVNFNAIVFCRL